MLSTIKRKLQFLLLLTIGGSMLLAGIALSGLFTREYEDNARKVFADFFDQAKSSLYELQGREASNVWALSGRGNLIDSLGLISEYADIDNYQAIIFDEEKKNIAELLFDFAGITRLEEIRVYDRRGWLAAYVKTRQEKVKGIVSFENGKPVIYSNTVEESDAWEPVAIDGQVMPLHLTDMVNTVVSGFTGSGTNMVSDVRAPIYRVMPDGAKKQIGMIVAQKYVDKDFLAAVSRRSVGNHAIVTAKRHVIGDAIAPNALRDLDGAADFFVSDNGDDLSWENHDSYFFKAYSIAGLGAEKFYIVSYLDKAVLNKQVANTRYTVLGVFSVAAILLFPIGMIFLRRSIINPIDNLVANARAIGEGEYNRPVQELGSDELNLLANTLHDTAQTVRERELQLRYAQNVLEQRVEERTTDLSAANENLQKEINERVRAEARLQESQSMLQLVMDNTPQYVFWKDVHGNYLGCNANFIKAAGLSSVDDLIGKSDYDLPWSRKEADYYREVDQRIIHSGKPEYRIQETQTTADGSLIYVETNKVPLFDEAGMVVGILGTYEDISDRLAAEKMLISAKEQAEAANRAKSEFLSRMSHELRTPLNAILGFAQVLKMSETSKLSQTDMSSLEEILTAGRHLLELIVEILDLSKIESGNMQINVENVALGSLLRECVSLTQSDALSRDINITHDPDNNYDEQVLADPVRLKQVLINLISNAVKYNKPGGSVVLRTFEENAENLRVEIIDTGNGIPRDKMQYLFKPFERLGAERLGVDGTGIGLLISKQFLELMHGKIGVDSEENVGTTVWFTIPLAKQQIDHASGQVSLAEVVMEGEADKMASSKIVYIEDNLANMRFMQKALEAHQGIQLLCADNAHEGLDLVQRERPDLVLMDIQMPGLDGYEALDRLRNNELTREIPVVAVSANAMESDIRYAHDRGFAAYLTKPLDVKILYSKIGEMLNGS